MLQDELSEVSKFAEQRWIHKVFQQHSILSRNIEISKLNTEIENWKSRLLIVVEQYSPSIHVTERETLKQELSEKVKREEELLKIEKDLRAQLREAESRHVEAQEKSQKTLRDVQLQHQGELEKSIENSKVVEQFKRQAKEDSEKILQLEAEVAFQKNLRENERKKWDNEKSLWMENSQVASPINKDYENLQELIPKEEEKKNSPENSSNESEKQVQTNSLSFISHNQKNFSRFL
jgi:hypothetical protein